MANFDVYIGPDVLGSMNDRLDPGIHPPGTARELRDLDLRRGLWEHRLGWVKLNAAKLPCDSIIGGCSFRNTVGVLHTLVAGDDGVLYHGLGERPTVWNPVTVYADVAPLWDATYRAKFARWRDDVFIAFWQPREVAVIPPAGTQNLRFRSTLNGAGEYVAYGVSIAAPATPVTLADGGVGNILPGTLDYKVTFIDNETGWPSDAPDATVATIILEQATAPTSVLTAAIVAPGAGALAAGRYEYCYTFYDTVSGIESEPSFVREQIVTAANAPANVQLGNIDTCKEGWGTWHRRIYRRDNGGGTDDAPYVGFLRLATLANNTTLTYLDNNAVAPGPAYAQTGRRVNLTNIPVYAGGGTPANGRDVWREIWRSDDGQPYQLLYTITDNTTTTYADNLAAAPGVPYVRHAPIPACGFVEVTPDGAVVWLHDRRNALPALVYLTKSDAEPEALGGTPRLAGTHDDPITGTVAARDGTFVSKLRAWHYLNRECNTCERVVAGFGSVADQGNCYLDTRMPFLSPEGPRLLKLYGEHDAPFLGSDGERFCLSELWRLVVKARLGYCAGVHWRAAGCVLWGVQLCDSWPISPPHNDTVIVWDYASIREDNPGGTVYVLSLIGWDCGWVKPGPTAAFDEIWGGFAMGFVGELFHGQHGDGTEGNLEGQVLAVSGNVVDVDLSALKGENVVGSTLYINGGTGTRICRPTEACEGARSLIIQQGHAGRLTLAGVLAIDTTSEFWIGGFPQVVDAMLNPLRDPKDIKTWDSIDVHVVP